MLARITGERETYASAAQEEVPAAADEVVVVDWAATRTAPEAARRRAVSCIVFDLFCLV